MFHAKEGWFFERVDTGDVRIMVKPPGTGTMPQAQVQLNADTWASVIAAVSARGETAETWKEALDFHNRK